MLDHLNGKMIYQMSGDDLQMLIEVLYMKIKQEQNIIENEWIDAEEAKKLLKIKSTSLYKLRSSNAIKISQFGSNILYSRSSILDFISTNIKTISNE